MSATLTGVLPASTIPAAPGAGRPLNDTSHSPGTGRINGKAAPRQPVHPGDSDVAHDEHASTDFGDVLASFLAACTLCASAQDAPTSPDGTSPSSTPAPPGFVIGGGLDLQGAVAFEGVGTGEVMPTVVLNDGLKAVASMESAATGSMDASFPTRDPGEVEVDHVGGVSADVGEMARSAGEVPASKPGFQLHAEWTIEGGPGGSAGDAPMGEPGTESGRHVARPQSDLSPVDLASLFGESGFSESGFGKSGSMSGPRAAGETGADVGAVGSDGDSGLAAALSVKVEAGPPHAQAPTATSAGTPVAPAPSAATQLADAIVPLRVRGDGTYDLTLELHPAELGAVRVRAVFENGTIQLHLQADNLATRNLLQDSLGGLRQALDNVGLNSGQLSVGAQAGWQGPAHGFGRQQDGSGVPVVPFSHAPRTLDDPEPTSSHNPSSTTVLDVLL